MHSYLFIGRDQMKIKAKLDELCESDKGRLIEYECKTIENIRELKHFVNLSSKEKTFIHLPNIDDSSEAAQNALLKTLEEPQKNIVFFLTAEIEEKVLPTVRSRCEIVRIQGNISEQQVNDFKEFVKLSVGQKLKLTSGITKREEAIEFLKELIDGGSIAIHEDPGVYNVLEQAQLALDKVQGNGNVQLQLTNFVVQGLPRSSD